MDHFKFVDSFLRLFQLVVMFDGLGRRSVEVVVIFVVILMVILFMAARRFMVMFFMVLFMLLITGANY